MKNSIFFFVFFLSAIPIFCQTVVWDESVDGDLQADGGNNATVFQEVTLVDGENIIRGSVGNIIFNGSDSGSDAFSFAVPPGASITAFDITSLTLQNGNMNGTYFGAYSGIPLTLNTGMGLPGPASLLSLFTGGGPLSSGNYGIAMNEGTIEGGIYEISINCTNCSREIPTLSQWGIIVLGILMLIVGLAISNRKSLAF